MREDQEEASTVFGDERDSIIRRAKLGRIGCTYDPDGGPLVIELPNGGRTTRRVSVSPGFANTYSTVDFTTITALGPYEAAWQSSTGIIEAHFESDRGTSPMMLARLPESQPIKAPQEPVTVSDEEEGDSSSAEMDGLIYTQAQEWVLTVKSEGCPIYLEISPPGPAAIALGGRRVFNDTPRQFIRPTLKIIGANPSGHDAALSILENMASAFFFELDLRRNILLRLSRFRVNRPLGRRVRSGTSSLSVPKKKYPNDAIALYTYGRQALGMPLLQFLAYYQCIEYFFPQYWNSELITRVRRLINDPRFDPDQDSSVGKVISAAAAKGRGGAPEREQLRTSVEACVDVEELFEFLEDHDWIKQALSGSTQSTWVGGVGSVPVGDLA